MKEEEVKKLEDITVCATESVSEGGNSSKAIASQVSSYAQVRNFYVTQNMLPRTTTSWCTDLQVRRVLYMTAIKTMGNTEQDGGY